jgi:hemerythrin-like domain-containing protein
MLHEEHRSTLDLLGRLDFALARAPKRGLGADADLVKLVGALARQVDGDLLRHFDFEERELFSRMNESGEGDIAGLLHEEHEAMRAVAEELLPLARAAIGGSLDDAGWAELKRAALEYAERQVAHIQKEEMALLPMLEDLLDDDTDRELALAYAASS